MKVVKKIIKIIVIILLIFAIIFVLNYARISIHYQINKKNYEEAFPVVGNTDHYVPQGLCYSNKYNLVLQTSYNGDHKVSELFVIDFNTKELLKTLELKNVDGTDQTHHVGGIATDNQTVWITNDYEVEEYSLEEIINTTANQIKSTRTTPLSIRGDFCTIYDGKLWIGDFYLKPFYDVPDGNPLLLGYSLNQAIDYNDPEVIISLPKMIQGLTFNEKGEFVFTDSFTYLILSNFTIYENVLNSPTDETINFNGKEIPYYHLTKENLIQKIKMPPMAEGLFYLDGSYYILFENSTDYYQMALPKMKSVIQYKTDKK